MTAERMQYQRNLQRFRKSLNNKYKSKPTTQSAVVVGPKHIKINGSYYNATVDAAQGSVASVINIGRPSAAIYSTAEGGVVAPAASISVTTGGGGGGGGPEIDTSLFVYRDGRYTITGNQVVSDGVTIDGIDISVHAANPNAHHNQVHNIIGTDHMGTGSPLDIIGFPTTNTLGKLTPSDAPGAATAILKSSTAGKLTLPLMEATTKLTVPLIDTASGNLTLTPAGNVDIDTSDLLGDSWSITAAGAATLTSVKTPLITTATNENLIIDPAGAGEVHFYTGQTISSISPDFDSSFPIAGWQINEHPTISGKSVLTIGEIQADELSVRVFVADETRVDRGDEYWTKSYGILSAPFTTPAISGNTSVTFEDSPALTGAIFSNNDWVLIRKLDIGTGLTLYSIWGQVSGYTDNSDGTQTWTFTMRSGPTGEDIQKGALAIDFGATGASLIHLSVIDAAGAPYIKMRTWATNPYEPANYNTHIQLGVLDGISNTYVAPTGPGIFIASPADEDQFILADDNGIQLYNTGIKLYESGTQRVNIDSAGTDVWIGNGSGNKILSWDGSTLDLLANNSAVITLDTSGNSYFAGIMTIGASGEIRQGTGTLGSNYTGLRIWQQSSVGRIAGYNSNTLQWYAGTDGKMYAGGGETMLDAGGVTINAATGAIDDINAYKFVDGATTMGGLYASSLGGYNIYFDSYASATQNALSQVRAQGNAVNEHATAILSASTSGASYEAYVSSVISGTSAILNLYSDGDVRFLSPTFSFDDHTPFTNHGANLGSSSKEWDTLYVQSIEVSGGFTSTLVTHDIEPATDVTYDLGSASKRFGVIYADQIIASTTSGSSIDGQEWEYPGSMVIDAHSSSNTTLSIVNQGTGSVSLTVNGSAVVTAARTISAGSGLAGGGTLSGNVTLSHADTSSQASVNASDGVVIQDVTLDTYGHVTALGVVDLDNRYMLASSGGGYIPTSRTVTAGSGLTGGGSLSANITISHADTSSQGSVNGSGGFGIQDVTLDTYGHVTALGLVNFDDRYVSDIQAGSAIVVSGTLPTLTVSHADTSTQASVNNSGQYFIQDITLDTYGHVTAIVSALAEGGGGGSGDYLELTGGTLTGALVGTDITLSGDLLADTGTFGDLASDGAVSFTGTFAITPAGDQAPFTLGTHAQGQTVTGLKADQLNKSISAGNGLSGGGALTADRTLAVDLTYAFAWTAQHSFSPATSAAPFTLGTNAQGVTVTGLKADQLNKSVSPGDGLSGGGALTSTVTLAVDSTVARRDAANTFTGDITIDNTTPALYLANDTATWEILGGHDALSLAEGGTGRMTVGSTVSVNGAFTVDGDTLNVSTSQKAVWINSGTPNGEATFKVTSESTEYITAVFRQMSGQTSDIVQYQYSDGNGMFGIDAAGNLQSVATAFVSGRSGWRISPTGDAEFNNIKARGEIRTALFTKDEIAVDSGSHLFTEGGLLRSEFTVAAGSLNLDIEDPASGHASLFAVGDNLLIRTAGERNYDVGSGPSIVSDPAIWFMPVIAKSSELLIAAETWLEVTAITDMTTYYRYTVEWRGGAYATYPAKSVVANYYQGDRGLIGIFTDRSYGPYMDVFLPSATPWKHDDRTTVRLGRLDGLGLSGLSAEQYGIAIGTNLSSQTAPRIIASDLQFSLYNIDMTIANDSGIGVQFSLNDDSYFGGFMYDDSEGAINIGQLVAGQLRDTQSYIQYYLAPSGSSVNTFDMRGSFQFYPVDDSGGAKQGGINNYLPTHHRYVSGFGTGFAIGTGTFGTPTNMLRATYSSSTAWKMAGFVSGVETWSVDQTGLWTFGNLAATGTAKLTSYDNTATGGDGPTNPSGIYWRYSSATTSRIDAYVNTSLPSRVQYKTDIITERTETGVAQTRLKARYTGDPDAYDAEVIVTSRIPTGGDLLTGNGVTILGGFLNVDAVALFQSGITLVSLEPEATVLPPLDGATIYVEDGTGDIKVIWSDATTATLLAKP